ncbi:hypothetical protein [Streptomyces pseudovenezuelae]|uniref:hypothetical protein n=1 Tax=Streptomyces pseudovenezuelae TaxID=67350 RepID=UPI002E81431E|nr:hypothetical protein [Streptomyces pseudovenezuelae]WUA87591.1 hypothetical protein OHO81_09970 [Streptomyces pseudovenezuelae]
MLLLEFAAALADRLPGWQPSPTAVPIATDPASDRIWDRGPLPYAAFDTNDIQRSVLTHHWGLQLYVMPRPHRPDEFLVLPMLPANTSHQHVQGLRAPRGIAVPGDPVRAAALLHRRLLTDYRLASPIPIRRSSPGHLQVHVTLDDRRRPRIRTGYLGVFIELLGRDGFLLDPETGECHLPDTLTEEAARRRLTLSVHRQRLRGFHITVPSADGPRTYPPFAPSSLRRGPHR